MTDHTATPFPDVLTLLRRQAAAHPVAVAIEPDGGSPLTYAALLERVETVATRLHRAGVGASGTGRPRIGIVLPNGVDMSVTLLTTCCMGVALPFNPAYRRIEFEDYFAETGIGHLLVPENGGSSVAVEAAQRLGIAVVRIGADGLPAAAIGSEAVARDGLLVPPDPSEVALILLTSGSTGRAKKVPLSHRNILTSARDVCRSMELGPADRCLSMWELYHVGGLVDLLLAPLHSGGTVIATAGFDATAFYRLLETARPTWFQAVPTALGEILFHAARYPVRTRPSPLRLIRSVAAALPPSLMAEAEARFGVPVIQTFGMTEAGPLVTSTRLPPAVRKPASVGTSCGAEVGVFGPQHQRLGMDETGEVAVRGENVFSGYEGDAAANAEGFRDGWFHTGDLGYLDADGHLFLTGRSKELINRGGEKVNPREVDDALLAHPAVAEAAAYPVIHRTLGEDVAAAVVLRPAMPVTETELRAFLATRLATFKVPQRLEFLDRLPRNAVGKIDRLTLTETAKRRIAAAPTSPTEATELEMRLAKIWATELRLPHVGPEQRFFDLGGDSLSGIRLFLAVEQAMGQTLPDAVLNNLTTVREMARQITANAGADHAANASVVTASGLTEAEQRALTAVMAMGTIPVVRPGSALKVANAAGKRRPLIWCFNSPAVEMIALAAALGPDQPLYGIYSGGRLFPRTDEKMDQVALFYTAEIMAAFPTGPLTIGGNCQGGRVAIRLLKNLKAAGRTVDTLCLMEFSHSSLAEFDGRLLLMFGRQSKARAYRWIEWGKPGWEIRFRRPPTVSWIAGAHGGFFYRHTIGSFVSLLVPFLAGQPRQPTRIEAVHNAIVTGIHRVPLLFEVYRRVNRLYEWCYRGRRIRLDPFTGEPKTRRISKT